MEIKIYIISLTDQIKRRKNILKALNNSGLSAEIIDAVDLRAASSEKIKLLYNFVTTKEDNKYRILTPGEIGCAASHIGIYNLIASRNHEYSLILEDDAIITDHLPIFLNSINHLPEWDIIILGYSKLKKNSEELFYKMEPIKKIYSNHGISLGTPWKDWTCGTVGYLITKNTANKLKNMKIFTVADNWEYLKKTYNLKILHCRPCLIFEDFENFESSIENQRKNHLKPARKWLNFIRVFRGYCRHFLLAIK